MTSIQHSAKVDFKKSHKYLWVGLLLLAVGLTSCSSVFSTTPSPSTVAPTLLSISLRPGPVAIAVGGEVQFSATGEYTDRLITFTKDLTSTVVWTSSDPSIAAISSSGLVTALHPGNTNIMAVAFGVKSETIILTVSAPSEPGNQESAK